MSRYRDRYGWPQYVPVGARRAQSQRAVEKLRERGEQIDPVEIEGRAIARSFWGKSWCSHLESFGDYSNRLPRGRSYVRSGAVCDLKIGKGRVDAMVSGSEMYNVEVDITPLDVAKWSAIKQRCTGRVASLIELLQGQMSDEIMATVTDRDAGLFPLPGEIEYTCDCPDWASMCKHVSAVMYGIGARLDTRPELLFLLRGVDHEELVSSDAVAEEITSRGSRRSRRRKLSSQDIEDVFGVELSDETDKPPAGGGKSGRRSKKTAASPAKKKVSRKRKAPFRPTAKSIASLRRKLGMSKSEFARAVGVSPVTIGNWEKSRGEINLQSKSREGLKGLIES